MSKIKMGEKLYNSLRKKVIAIKTKFRDKYDDDHQKIIDSPEYKKLLKKRLTRDEKDLLKEEKTNPLNSGEFELFLPFKDGTFITGISRVKGVRRKVKNLKSDSEIEKILGRTLTERERQYLKSESDLNPKNFYKGGVVDIVDAGKYFKHKSKR